MQLEPESVYRMLRGKKIGLYVYMFFILYSSNLRFNSFSRHWKAQKARWRISRVVSTSVSCPFGKLCVVGKQNKNKKPRVLPDHLRKSTKLLEYKIKKTVCILLLVTIIYDQASSWTQKRRMLPDNSLVPSLYL